MKVLIVDDEPAARRALRECCAADAGLEVAGECGDGAGAIEAIRSMRPDLVFLDIQMDSVSGLAVAREVAGPDGPLVVFVTAYDEYAVEAFELHAVDYLLKPFDDERFRATVARVRERLASQDALGRSEALATLLRQLESRNGAAAPRLLAEAFGRQHMLDPARIELVESDRNYVKFRVGPDVFHARSTLQQAEQALQSQPVLKVSRSCLVNMNHVREVSRTLRGDFILVLACGATVTSSEGCRDRVREYLDRLRL